MNNTNINTSQLACQFQHPGLRRYPGIWFTEQADTQKKAEILFKNFLNHKLPLAEKLIIKLINSRHITAVHLPMTINLIFLTYIKEQVELYQNQQEERDLDIDRQWEEFCVIFAHERHSLFTHDPVWAGPYFTGLKDLLKNADVLAEDVDATLDLWLQIISTAHIGDMYLTTVFVKEAKCCTLNSGKDHVETYLSRQDLESAFHAIVHQWPKTLKWLSQKLETLVHDPEDERLEPIFDVMTNQSLKEVCTFVANLKNDCKILVQELLSVNLTDNVVLELLLTKIHGKAVFIDANIGDLNTYINGMEEAQKSGKSFSHVGNQETNKQIPLPKDLVQPYISLLKDLQECHLLVDCYFLPYCYSLERILRALIPSNNQFEKYQKEGTIPPLASKYPSILPSPTVFNEKAYEELCSSSTPVARTKKKGRRQQTNNNSAQGKDTITTSTQQKPQKADKQEKIIEIVRNNKPLLTPLEQLRELIFTLYHLNPCVALRQSLWHVDRLISLDSRPFQESESLMILNLAASSAHKLLEQIYRSKGITLQSHNLKQYHSACSSLPRPEIVKELYLANHWTRYFYLEQEKWKSFSTQVVCTPILIDELVKMAEGTPISKEQLQQRVKGIIEKTYQVVTSILPKIELQNSDSILAQDVPIAIKTLIPTDAFHNIQESLSQYLAQSSFPHHHSVYLYIKQAIAALSMLSLALEKVQTASSSHELATWISFCMLQMQEATEDVLHAIEFMNEGEASNIHELKTLSEKVKLDMEKLAEAFSGLSYKTRYPAETISNGLGAQIIDEVEALRQCPECLEGFKFQDSPSILWKQIPDNLSLESVMEKFCVFIDNAAALLQKTALPALLEASPK